MDKVLLVPVVLVIVLAVYFKFVKSRELLGDGLLIAFGGFFAFLFAEFAIYGTIYAWEPSRIIAGAELVMSIFIVLLGLERLHKDLKKGKEEV